MPKRFSRERGRNLLDHLAAEDLVAGFHVGKIQIGDMFESSVSSRLPTECQK